MSFFKRFLEAFQQRTKAAVAVWGSYDDFRWPDWQRIYETYRNPAVALAVDMMTYAVMGAGFYVTSKDEDAKARVENFIEKTDLKGLLFDVVRELVLAGNSFLRFGDDGLLHRVPLHWFTGSPPVEVDPDTLEPVRFNIVRRVGVQVIRETIPAEELIHFRWNRLDPAIPWGLGIAYQLLATQRDWRGRIVPSVFDSEATLRRDLVLFMDRAIPKTVFKLRAADTEFERQREELEKAIREPGADILTNQDIEAKPLQIPDRIKFEFYDYFANMFHAALRSPVIRLFTTPGFTEASAKEATNLFENAVRALREYVEHVVETQIFSKITSSHVEMHWGQPKLPEYRIEDILNAVKADEYTPSIITREEARKMLRELGWILEAGVSEAFHGRVVDTLADVQIYLVDPSDIDRTTLRYYPVDSEKGVTVVTAWVKSRQDRRPVLIIFNKSVYQWTKDRARAWYSDVFPTVLEKLI
ncbi:MAG: hypothetical protein QW544_03575 [Candidatus Caldarchaeum sp.]